MSTVGAVDHDGRAVDAAVKRTRAASTPDRVSAIRELIGFVATWVIVCMLMLPVIVASWFLVPERGGIIAIAAFSLLPIGHRLVKKKPVLGSSGKAELAVLAIALVTFLTGELIQNWPGYLALSVGMAAALHLWRLGRSGIATATVLFLALFGLLAGAAWQVSFAVSSGCLESRADAAAVGEHPAARCGTYAYDQLTVTANKGRRAAWFEGNAPQEPGTLDLWVKRGIVHSREVPPDCPNDANSQGCLFEPLADDWFEYTYSIVIWS